ncbi:MAG TPA: hypothetical protein VGX96_11125 [Candidatus Elarobacter sp.]|jgi:hypothetical protein|nr:hypothetical protein [Candidatus Elarobacter sp.]
MTLENAVVTFEKSIGPGVFVHITSIPAEIVHADGKDDLTLFDVPTSGRLQHLLRVARGRMANGETDITIDFADDA